MAPRVVLVGAPGAGKSTVGRLVATRLGVGFRDTDHDVEDAAGKSVADVFLDDGEEAFRAAEATAVHAALVEHAGVLALGGGAVLSAETRRLLAGHRVVHLQVGLTDAASRVGFAQARPVIALNPRAQLKVLLDERAPLYAEVATAVVVTDARAPDDIAAAVVEAIS
jgi:shikimate kinase